MDRGRLTSFVRARTEVRSRRTALGALAGGLIAILTPSGTSEVRAKHHQHHRHHKHPRRRKHPKPPICTLCQPAPACDVCLPAGACAFTTVQAAIDATSPQLSSVRVCAGTYVGDLLIERPLTVIGVGDEADPAANTILQGTGNYPVVSLYLVEVTLQRLRITGGRDVFAGGIYNAGTLMLTDSTVVGNTATHRGGGIYNTVVATLTLTGSVITGNTCDGRGGGIYNDNATTTLDAASRVIGNAAAEPRDPDSGGGIYNDAGTVTMSSATNVSGNTPDQCGGAAVPLCAG